MASIYDREQIMLSCPKCGREFHKRLIEIRTTSEIPCPACAAPVPIVNLTQLVSDAVSKRLEGEH